MGAEEDIKSRLIGEISSLLKRQGRALGSLQDPDAWTVDQLNRLADRLNRKKDVVVDGTYDVEISAASYDLLLTRPTLSTFPNALTSCSLRTRIRIKRQSPQGTAKAKDGESGVGCGGLLLAGGSGDSCFGRTVFLELISAPSCLGREHPQPVDVTPGILVKDHP